MTYGCLGDLRLLTDRTLSSRLSLRPLPGLFSPAGDGSRASAGHGDLPGGLGIRFDGSLCSVLSCVNSGVSIALSSPQERWRGTERGNLTHSVEAEICSVSHNSFILNQTPRSTSLGPLFQMAFGGACVWEQQAAGAR